MFCFRFHTCIFIFVVTFYPKFSNHQLMFLMLTEEPQKV